MLRWIQDTTTRPNERALQQVGEAMRGKHACALRWDIGSSGFYLGAEAALIIFTRHSSGHAGALFIAYVALHVLVPLVGSSGFGFDAKSPWINRSFLLHRGFLNPRRLHRRLPLVVHA